jgi:hypothetical protein
MNRRDRARAARAIFRIGALALLPLGIFACGSSDTPAGGAGDGSAPASGSGPLTWLEDGKRHTAPFGSAARVTSAMIDMVQVSGGEAGGTGISFGVSMPPPLVPGTYPCGVSGNRIIVSFSYTSAGLYQTCSVTLTSIGAKSGERAVGSFSATFPASGGTKLITSGTFDVPLTVNSI